MADPIKPTAADTDLAGWFERRMDAAWKGRTTQLIAQHAQQAREQALEEIEKACEEQIKVFSSEQYAVNQPLSSFGERFALGTIISIIQARKEQPPC